MELIINQNVTQDDFNKFRNEYLNIKNRIMFGLYESDEELIKLKIQKEELNKKWNFEEESKYNDINSV